MPGRHMIDISTGRYWDRGIQLIDGCTPCSPGCDHCWSAAQAHRFKRHQINKFDYNPPKFTNEQGIFTGEISIYPERLDVFRKTKKPTVFAIWNDLFHESVPFQFQLDTWMEIERNPQHTFLILTKRPDRMSYFYKLLHRGTPEQVGSLCRPLTNIFNGLTVCNQAEAEEKIPVFLQVPGKKFLSIEPMLEHMLIKWHLAGCDNGGKKFIDAVILGGETGVGARPMHPDWVRAIRDQCTAASVDFFFKGWGKNVPFSTGDGMQIVPWGDYDPAVGGKFGWYLNGKNNRILDGRTHDSLPWKKG